MNYMPANPFVTMYRLARSFIRSTYLWSKGGFKLVHYHEYWRRRSICNCCLYPGPTHKCLCGCWLFLLARLDTAKCSHWDSIVRGNDELKNKIYPVYG